MRMREVDHQAIGILHASDLGNDLSYLQKAVDIGWSRGYVTIDGLWLPSGDSGVISDLATEGLGVYSFHDDTRKALTAAAIQRFRQPPDSLSLREQEVQRRMESPTDLRPLSCETIGAVALIAGRLPAVNRTILAYDEMVTFNDALRAGHVQV